MVMVCLTALHLYFIFRYDLKITSSVFNRTHYHLWRNSLHRVSIWLRNFETLHCRFINKVRTGIYVEENISQRIKIGNLNLSQIQGIWNDLLYSLYFPNTTSTCEVCCKSWATSAKKSVYIIYSLYNGHDCF